MGKNLRIAWDEDANARSNARTHLPILAEQYFRAGREMLEGKHSHKAMHKFRLRTKHFRYTLELFRSVYGATLEKRLEMLKPVQDALGDLNDCASARELLGKHSRKTHAFLKKRAKKKIAEFKDCWRDAFDAPGQGEDWLKYLAAGGRAR